MSFGFSSVSGSVIVPFLLPPHTTFSNPEKKRRRELFLRNNGPLATVHNMTGPRRVRHGAKGAIAPPLGEISFDFINNGTMIHTAFLMAFFVGKLIFQLVNTMKIFSDYINRRNQTIKGRWHTGEIYFVKFVFAQREICFIR